MLNLLKSPEMDIVSLSEVKAHLRLDHSEEDDYLKALMAAATNFVEQYLGRSLLSRTWQLRWDKPKDGPEISQIPLPFPPFLEIISVNNLWPTKQPIKRYIVDECRSLPILTCYVRSNAAEVIYRAGYGNYPKDIPASIQHAVLLAIADFYENRVTTTIQSQTIFHSLLAPYRIVGMA